MDLRKLRIDTPRERDRNDDRDDIERDYGRLIGSPAFRRMQGKSQVFGAGSGDYYRTRLTHSLEVSQIARELAKRMCKKHPELNDAANPGLIIDPAVVECAALAHDLGHPPFGHKGEAVLNGLMQKHQLTYEGNAQNFRILMFLEKRAGSERGLDLTAAVLLGINKYPGLIEAEGRLKGVYASEWPEIDQIRRLWGVPDGCATLEAQLMDLSDDIAYSTHDIEDGIRAGKIQMNTAFFEDERLIRLLVEEIRKDENMATRLDWQEVDVEESVKQVLSDYWKQWKRILGECRGEASRARRKMKARWVNRFAGSVGIADDAENGWKTITFVQDGQRDIELLRTMDILKKLAWVTLIKDFRVQRIQKRSEIILTRLWETFLEENKAESIIPPDWMESYEKHQSKWPWPRFIADYISGMTDAYAEKVYLELFGGRSGSIYEMD